MWLCFPMIICMLKKIKQGGGKNRYSRWNKLKFDTSREGRGHSAARKHSEALHWTSVPADNRGVPALSSLQRFKMSGIATKLQHNRDRAHGIGTNSHAQKYLNQDFESLRASCLERGELFRDECFEALPSSLGFNELGPNSYNVRGITWKRPTVGARHTPIMLLGDSCSLDIGKLNCIFRFNLMWSGFRSVNQ